MSSYSDLILSEELERTIYAFFEENHDNPSQEGFQEIFPSHELPTYHPSHPRPITFPPLGNGKDYWDGHLFSRDTTTALHRGALLRDDSAGYYFTDANQSDAGGDLTLDPHTGLLSVINGHGPGEVFYKIHRRWIVDASGQIKAECFSLQSSSNKQLYLAMNKDSPYYSVQGMTIEEMGDISNSYWRYVPFSEIGYSPPGSGYLALQYWGNHFGPPSSKSYYFVMEINNRSAPFRIASKETAAKSGRLGHRSSRT